MTRDLSKEKAIDLLLAAKWLGCELKHDARLGYCFAAIEVDKNGLPTLVRTRNVRGLVAFVNGWLANKKVEPWRFQLERKS